MYARRLLIALILAGLALAGLVVPAASQTQAPPAINIFSVTPRCMSGGTEGSVSGAVNRSHVRLQVFAPSGAVVFTGIATASGGGYTATFGLSPAETGEYELRVTAGTFNTSGGFTASTPVATASVFVPAPCRPPVVEFDPPCSTPSTAQLRVTGRLFQPNNNGYVDVDVDGSVEAGRIPINNRGTFVATVTIKPSSSPRRVQGYDLANNTAQAEWPTCPPGSVPTTTTSTTQPTVPGSTTTAPTTTTAPPPDDEPRPTTTVTAPPGIPGFPSIPPPAIDVPPTIELPPATPGATLTVSPKIGPTGFVTGAVGTGFPPGGAVEVTWSGGIGKTVTIAGPDGTFTIRMLVMPNDRIGPRALVAVGGLVTAFDSFLVVPSSVQPSGQDVSQITRIRRFNQR